MARRAENPLITIAIPAYNADAHLQRAIDSVLGQTYRNIELLVLDDCSTDNTAAIAQDAARNDSRLRLHRHQSNHERFEARRSCVEHARGDYLMFLDADDWLTENVCELCVRELSAEPFDILHFAAKPVYSFPVAQEVEDSDTEYLRPEEGIALGPDIAHRIFLLHKGPWAMWGKVFSTKVLQETLDSLPRQRLFMAEDAYTFFAVAHFAYSYRAIPDIDGYRYAIDVGESGSDRVLDGNLDGLRRVCSTRVALDALSAFIADRDAWRMYGRDYERLRKQFTDDAVGYLVTRIPKSETVEAFSVLMDYWQPEEALEALLRRGEDEAFGFVPDMLACSRIPSVSSEREVLAVFVDDRDPYLEEIIDFAMGNPKESVVALINEGGPRYGLQNRRCVTVAGSGLYRYRLRSLAKTIEELGVGTFCVPTKNEYPFIWDAYAAQLMGCYVLESKDLVSGSFFDTIGVSGTAADR